METVEKKFEKAEVEAVLATGLTRICFMKVDGDYREIIGTRDMTIIPEDHRPESMANSRMKRDTTVPFYAVEEGMWKSFVLENLVKLEKE